MTEPLRVWHDPGHGGLPNRGLEHDGFVERDWVVELASGYLQWRYKDDFSVMSGCQARLAREQHRLARLRDEYILYTHRARAAEEWGADVAVLHHVNGIFFPKDHPRAGQANSAESGLAVFVVKGDLHLAVHQRSYDLARQLLLAVRRPLQLWKGRTTPHRSKRFGRDGRKHWTRRARSHLRHYVNRGIPAVLVEWSFATSDSDRRTLLDPSLRAWFYRPLDALVDHALRAKRS
jgi:N-acetylmuramoyl-L-alanine amidase